MVILLDIWKFDLCAWGNDTASEVLTRVHQLLIENCIWRLVC